MGFIIKLFFLPGEGPSLPPWSATDLSSTFPTGAVICALITICLLIAISIDVVCCKIHKTGLTHYMCSKTRRGQSKTRKRSSQRRVPPIICSERTVPPGIKQKQSIIGTREIEPLVSQNSFAFISAGSNGGHAARV